MKLVVNVTRPKDIRNLDMIAGRTSTLTVASLATALVLMIFTVPLTTLTSTAQALGADAGAQAWILERHERRRSVGSAGSGAIGDDYGRRRTFVAGTVVLALASVLGALAPNALTLIVARIVQGLGGGAILACGLGLIGQAYPGRALARATGIWAAALGAGVAVGPILFAGLDISEVGPCPTGSRRFPRPCWPLQAACCSRNRALIIRAGSICPARCF